jgi:very-short-patch-repair endonuclease
MSTNKLKCKYCGKIFPNKGGLNMHEKACKNITDEIRKNIRSDYENGISIKKLNEKYNISRCVIINILGDLKRNISEASKLARKLYPEKFKFSEEVKKRLSEKRLAFIKAHPEKTAWRTKNLSYPEKCFLKLLEAEQLNLKYNIIREYSVFPYYIDFAFTDLKLAIEIDGSQHLNAENKINDSKKDELLNSLGWKVVRIEARAIMYEYEMVKEKLLKLLDGYKNLPNNHIINSKIQTHSEYKKEQKMRLDIEKEKAKLNFIETRKKLILNSGIDFSKFGWINKLAKELNLSHTQCRRWMIKFMPDFYSNCFKR